MAIQSNAGITRAATVITSKTSVTWGCRWWCFFYLSFISFLRCNGSTFFFEGQDCIFDQGSPFISVGCKCCPVFLINAHVKDRTPTLDKSNVIYKFLCSCESMYVGRTTQRLQARVKQHIPKFLLTFCKQPESSRKTIKHKTKLTSIGQHLKDNPKCGFAYDPKQFSVLARARTEFHLEVLESIFIKSLDPVLCKQKEFVYSLLLYKTPF